MACGEWIAFVDADDSVDEGFFDVLKEGLGYDLVIGGYKTLPKGEIYYNFEGDFKDDTMGDFIARHLWNGYVWGKFLYGSSRKDDSGEICAFAGRN